jgi:hypothetical protein
MNRGVDAGFEAGKRPGGGLISTAIHDEVCAGRANFSGRPSPGRRPPSSIRWERGGARASFHSPVSVLHARSWLRLRRAKRVCESWGHLFVGALIKLKIGKRQSASLHGCDLRRAAHGSETGDGATLNRHENKHLTILPSADSLRFAGSERMRHCGTPTQG